MKKKRRKGMGNASKLCRIPNYKERINARLAEIRDIEAKIKQRLISRDEGETQIAYLQGEINGFEQARESMAR